MFSILDTIRRITQRGDRQSSAGRGGTKAPPEVAPGKHWKHLQIVDVLGQGSFGTVLRAVDLQLNREVALKFLQTEDAIREGKILANLNEENIVKVHSFEEHEGATALCLELIRGTTLERFWQQHGNLTAEHAALLGIQICRALAALHRKGLLHRDLKPSNVILGADGRLVLIDLGLGAAWSEITAEIAGTLPFMAPEILEGQPADRRSDLYSLAALLFFLVTGRYLVEGNTIDEFRECHDRSRRRHLTDEGSFPPAFVNALETGLATDPAQRFRSAGEFMVALESVLVQRHRRRLSGWKIAAAAAIVVVLLAVATGIREFGWFSAPPSPTSVETTELVRGPGLAHSPSVSANGQVLVYSWDGGNSGHMNIWAKYPNQKGASRLTWDDSDHLEPAVSPDGTIVVYRSERDGGGLYMTSTLGGGERKLAGNGRDPKFSPDGTKVAYWTGLDGNYRFATGRIFVIPVAGGMPLQLVPEFADARRPIWSPDGKWILFLGTKPANVAPDQPDWYLTQVAPPQKTLQLNFAEQLRLARLRPYECPVSWAGNTLYFAAYQGESSNLWSSPVSMGWRRSVGKLQRITAGPAIEAEPHAIANGMVAFSTLISSVNIYMSSLEGSRPATSIMVTSPSFTITSQPSISRDGKSLAFVRKEGRDRSAYLRDMVSGQETLIVASSVMRPVISPDGGRVAFSRKQDGKESIWVYDRQAATTEMICADCGMVLDWLPNLGGIVYSGGARPAIALLDLTTRRSSTLLESTATTLYDQLHFSPDGRHVAFVRQVENARREIVIAAFSQHGLDDESQWKMVNIGSRWDTEPRWTPDGRALVFLSRRDSYACIWRVSVDASGSPANSAAAIQHLHAGNHSTQELSDISFELAVGGGSVVYSLSDLSGTIWAAQPKTN